jgi:hypothetical protein
MKILKVLYDDRADQVIDNINELLKPYKIYFECDNKVHDAFDIYELKEKK